MTVPYAVERRRSHRPDGSVAADDGSVAPAVRAGFVAAALIGSLGILVSATLGLTLAVMGLLLLALVLVDRDGAPLLHHVLVAIGHARSRVRGDGSSGETGIRPWPHVATLPAALAGTELLDADCPVHGRCGVVWHRPTGLMSATLLLEPSALVLSDPAVGETYTACWWTLLADAASRADVTAAAVTVDVAPAAGSPPAVRFTVTVDPCARERIRCVTDAAALTVGALAAIDTEAAGVVACRPATATDLATIARAAFEPRTRWVRPGEEPPAWGELSPRTEASGPRSYQHERYTSVSYAMHAPSGRRFDADAVPHLLAPGTHPRRVTLVRREGPRGTVCSVFVTVSVERTADFRAARAELESLLCTAQPRLEVCRNLQAEAFGVGLPAGWFAPHAVELNFGMTP
ncbi:MAG TPA: SCO6880 family protein [Sporichthya sp.]|nr:SCO6880 family protein [Sporichthya sp.]